MLIRVYRDSHPSSFFTLPFIALLCWIPFIFFRPETFIVQVPHQPMPVYEWLYSGISKLHVFVQYIISWILISVQAIYLNQLIVKHELFPRLSFLPALFFITLSVLFPEMMQIQPALFVNLILLIVLDKIFMLYKNSEPLGKVFDASFLLATATLMDSSALAFYLYLLLSLVILLPFHWRVWVISLIGFALPYYFISVYFFLTGSLRDFWVHKIPNAFHILHFIPPNVKPMETVTGLLYFSSFYYFSLFGFKTLLQKYHSHPKVFSITFPSYAFCITEPAVNNFSFHTKHLYNSYPPFYFLFLFLFTGKEKSICRNFIFFAGIVYNISTSCLMSSLVL
jgi:hypothetical protein